MKKMYGVATQTREVFGHGDSVTYLSMKPTGAYHTGPFPPVFKSRAGAEKWAKAASSGWDKKVVVELKVDS